MSVKEQPMIKDAENIGLVSTIQRVGTIRIERKLKKHIEKLTSAKSSKSLKAMFWGSAASLDKDLNKFVIGAMKDQQWNATSPGS